MCVQRGFCVCFCVGLLCVGTWLSFMQIWKSCVISPSSKCHLWLFTDKPQCGEFAWKHWQDKGLKYTSSSLQQTRTHRYQWSRLIRGVFNAHLFFVLAEPKPRRFMWCEKVESIPTTSKYHLVIIHHPALCHCQYNYFWHRLSFHFNSKLLGALLK